MSLNKKIILNAIEKTDYTILANDLNITIKDLLNYTSGTPNETIENNIEKYLENNIYEKLTFQSCKVFLDILNELNTPGIYNIIVPEDSGHDFFLSKATQTAHETALTTKVMDFPHKNKIIINRANPESQLDITTLSNISTTKPVLIISAEELGITNDYYYVPGLSYKECFEALKKIDLEKKVDKKVLCRLAWLVEQRFSLLIKALKVLTIHLEAKEPINNLILDLI